MARHIIWGGRAKVADRVSEWESETGREQQKIILSVWLTGKKCWIKVREDKRYPLMMLSVCITCMRFIFFFFVFSFIVIMISAPIFFFSALTLFCFLHRFSLRSNVSYVLRLAYAFRLFCCYIYFCHLLVPFDCNVKCFCWSIYLFSMANPFRSSVQ